MVVVALRQEARYLQGVDVVFTGPGKVSAATKVAEALAAAPEPPSFVVNAGTAGALRDGLTGVHRVGRVIEHDFDRDGLTALLGEPLPGEIIIDSRIPITLATGDVFVQDSALRAELAKRADLVDMEGYAVARACLLFDVRCEIVKVVSDEASEDALRSWQDTIDHTARLLAEEVDHLCSNASH